MIYKNESLNVLLDKPHKILFNFVLLIKLPVNIFFHTAIKGCFLNLHFEFMLKFTMKKKLNF